MLDGEELAGAVKALLHLLGDEEDAVGPAHLIELLHENGVSRQHAAVALHGLDDHGGHLAGRQPGGKGRLHLLQALALHHVVRLIHAEEGEGVDLRQERPHLLVHLGGAGGHGGRAVGVAVIAVEEHDDLLPSRVGSGVFHCRVVGVGAAVAEADLGRHAAGIDGDQMLGILNAALVVAIRLGVLGKVLQLPADGLCDHRVGAAQIQGGSAGKKIDKAVAVHICDDAALAFLHRQREIGQVLARGDHLLVPCHPFFAFCGIHVSLLSHITIRKKSGGVFLVRKTPPDQQRENNYQLMGTDRGTGSAVLRFPLFFAPRTNRQIK